MYCTENYDISWSIFKCTEYFLEYNDFLKADANNLEQKFLPKNIICDEDDINFTQISTRSEI